jgi:hypothetical protein
MEYLWNSNWQRKIELLGEDYVGTEAGTQQ